MPTLNRLTRDVLIVAAIVGEERYVLLYEEGRESEACHAVGRWADEYDLNFTWNDAARVAHETWIHRHRTRPAEQESAQPEQYRRHQNRTDRVDVPDRIEAQPALRFRSAIAKGARDPAMSDLMQGNREQDGNCGDRKPGQERGNIHGVSRWRPRPCSGFEGNYTW